MEGLQENRPGLVWGHGKNPGLGAGWGCLQGAAGGWSCDFSASLSRGPGAGVALEKPQDHKQSLQSPLCPSQPGLGVSPLPCWASVGFQGQLRAGNAGGTVPNSGAHLAAWHTRASWGTAFKFSLPKSYYSAAPCPCTGSTIPVNFPASPSPASGCNCCAWQLLPSATARVCSSSPPLPGHRGSCGSARRSHLAQELCGHWGGQRVALEWLRHGHRVGTARALHSPGTATAQVLHGLCVTTAWPTNGYCMAS